MLYRGPLNRPEKTVNICWLEKYHMKILQNLIKICKIDLSFFLYYHYGFSIQI